MSIQPSSSIKGEGGFGCVIAPPPKCTDISKNNKRAQLAKIQTKDRMEKEVAQNKVIDGLDPDENYHMKALGQCFPKLSDHEYAILKEKCRHSLSKYRNDKKVLEEKTEMLLMRDGGMTWEEFSLKEDLKLNDIKRFLISSYNVVRGTQDMLENDFIHDDLKSFNILYCMVAKKSIIIDFGRSGKKSEIKKGRPHENKISNFEWHPYDAPDRHFRFPKLFDNAKTLFKDVTNSGNFRNDNKMIGYVTRQGDGYEEFSKFHYKHELFVDHFNENVFELLEQIRDKRYQDFIETSINAADVFGLAFSLVQVTFNLLQGLETYEKTLENNATVNLIRSIRELAVRAANVNPENRPTPKKFAQDYEKCIMNYISPPDIVNSDSMEAYTNKIGNLYPQDTFSAKSESHLGYSWVDVSKIVAEYEPVLKLELLEFINESVNNNNNAFIDKLLLLFESKFNYIDLAQGFSSYNLKGPQKESLLNGKYDLGYFNLLGSLYCIYITKFPDANHNNYKSTNTPKILIDESNAGMHIQWSRNNKESMIYLPLAPQNGPMHNKNSSTRLQKQTEEALVACINEPANIVDFALILEIACLTLAELFVPSNIATKILHIICDSSDLETANVREFEHALLGIIKTVRRIDKTRFLNLYQSRYNLSLLRGAIACSDSAKLKQLRKVYGIAEYPKMGHRSHAEVGNMNNLINNYRGDISLCDGIGALQQGLEDASGTPKEKLSRKPKKSAFNKILKQMVQDMSPPDVAFTYRGYNISVKQVLDQANDEEKQNLPFKNVIDSYYCEDVVARINKHSIEKQKIKVYTQLQVDAMVMMPQKFKDSECRNLFRHIKQKGNTVYVIFEDMSRGNEQDRFLVHGFQLQFKEDQPAEYGNTELVVLVPKACLFKVLEPITWRFLKLLDNVFKENFNINDSFAIIKKPMLNLSKYVYNRNFDKVYVSRNASLIQVELIANNYTDLKITSVGITEWQNQQYCYIFQNIFT